MAHSIGQMEHACSNSRNGLKARLAQVTGVGAFQSATIYG